MAHPDYIREKAIELRVRRRLTIDEIAERLGVSRTTVYYWVGLLPIPETEKQSAARQRASDANRDRARHKRDEAYEEGAAMFSELVEEPTFRDFVCMYIGEGTKRNRNVVALCNSDPAVIKLAQTWILRFARNPVRYTIQYHADQSLDELRRFWSAHLHISPDEIRFQRKSNSSRLASRSWRSRHGVLTVVAADTYFRSKLQAWIDLVKGDWG